MTTPPLPEQIELHRDRMWRRDEDLRVESAIDAEHFIEDVGFANTLTDARRAGPSLYIAVCGMTLLGETARASGLSRVEAGSGNHQLVDEGYALRLRQAIYALASSKNG